ncbi:helix-turn-helix domain-containing protein [Candidatus Babeliales bacterium]|nr:helix-turn-helix domain-containing protein [Candidatus Babeliales bacterium]MCF7899515.1 helix-turn-helix domain-containing protein [Candidatus Babeliales bacterium]
MAQTFQNLESVTPSVKDIELAKKSRRALSSVTSKKRKFVEIKLSDSKESSKNIIIPLSAFKLFVSILEEMAEGNSVRVVPIQAELTTQEAADLLNVSRPYLIQLLESKKIPFRKVGSRRKVLMQDLITYKAKTDQARCKVLDALTKEAQKLDLGY